VTTHICYCRCGEDLTGAFKFLVVQICHVLSLQLVRGEAPGVQPQTGHPPQPACQPGQVTVTDEIVVGQTKGAQSVQVLEHVLAERRKVVVVQGPGTWKMGYVRLCK
jgi:hypothetical protein